MKEFLFVKVSVSYKHCTNAFVKQIILCRSFRVKKTVRLEDCTLCKKSAQYFLFCSLMLNASISVNYAMVRLFKVLYLRF